MNTSKIAMPIMDTFKTTQGKRNADNSDYSSFDTIMNKNIQADKGDTGRKESSIKKEIASNMKDVSDKQTASPDKSSSTNQIAAKEESGKVSSQQIKNSADGQNLEQAIPNEVMAALSQLEQMILKNVSEQLGISMEELSNQLDQMELSPLDLLNTEDLKQFVLNLNGAESPIEFLTNENMEEQFKNLLETVEQIPAEDLGITKEQLNQIIPLLTDDKVKVLQDNSSKLMQQENQSEAEYITVDIQSEGGEESIPVTVTKETSGNENNLSEQNTAKMQQDERNQRDDRPSTDENEKPIDLFIQNLSNRQVSNLDHMSQAIDRSQMMKDIVHQIVEKIKVSIKPESTSMEMQLNPEHLGKINLTVVEKNGEMTANIITQNHAAKEAIESQIQTLRESLNNQGLKVEAVEVTVSEFAFRQDTQTGQGTENQDNKDNHSNRRKIDLSTFDENEENVTEEEKLAAKVMRENGGSVDYTV